MAGQGAITRAMADLLSGGGWHVVFKCIPNTPHLNVVPIPTAHGVSKQRYPDILAYRDATTKLLEVEITLNAFVAQDIETRFREMVEALSEPHAWRLWRDKIRRDTGHTLPEIFIPQCDLVLCKKLTAAHAPFVEALKRAGINVSSAEQYRS